MRKYPVLQSEIELVERIDESNFTVQVFKGKRKFGHPVLNFYNAFFSDKLLVIRIPIKEYTFQNLVLAPIGEDRLSKKQDIYFNTLYFDEDFNATTGLIVNYKSINKKKPRKSRIGVDRNGKLSKFSLSRNRNFKDVLQIPYTFKANARTNKTFRTLNYRHFVCIENGELIYMAGYGNSLISWLDIQSVMKKIHAKSAMVLDGGASLEYRFEGQENKYSYSSIPFRRLWFSLNSPYYLVAEKKNQ